MLKWQKDNDNNNSNNTKDWDIMKFDVESIVIEMMMELEERESELINKVSEKHQQASQV